MVSRIGAVGLLALVLPLGALPDAGAQEAVTSLADGRAGKIHFASQTPAGYFALARRESNPKVVVFGTLRLPPPSAGRVPAMVIAHGSAGVDQRESWWAETLTKLGLATFVVDSFTPRGVRQTATDQSQLSTAANVADALAALRLLGTHPRIDPQRVGVIGFSKGGQVALYSALEPFRRAVIDDDARFAAHVALYPYSNDWYTAARVTGAPMLLLLGGRDDYTPAEACRGYAEWFKAAGGDTTVIVYPDAYHDFDDTSLRARARDRQALRRPCGSGPVHREDPQHRPGRHGVGGPILPRVPHPRGHDRGRRGGAAPRAGGRGRVPAARVRPLTGRPI
jgi:dienelactone hydrolase